MPRIEATLIAVAMVGPPTEYDQSVHGGGDGGGGGGDWVGVVGA